MSLLAKPPSYFKYFKFANSANFCQAVCGCQICHGIFVSKWAFASLNINDSLSSLYTAQRIRLLKPANGRIFGLAPGAKGCVFFLFLYGWNNLDKKGTTLLPAEAVYILFFPMPRKRAEALCGNTFQNRPRKLNAEAVFVGDSLFRSIHVTAYYSFSV